MNKKIEKFNRTISYILLGIMIVMFASIILRVFTRQILVEKFGMNNAFTKAVFFDAIRLQNEETKTSDDKKDYQAIYPFKEENGGFLEEDEVVELTGESSPKYGKLSTYLNLVDSIKTKIEDYCGKFLMGHDAAANVAATVDNLLLWDAPMNPEDFNRIIRMENGYLTYVQPRIKSEEIDRMVDSIADFDDFLQKEGIELLVINNGSKINPEDTQLSAYESQFEHTNENGDELMNKLYDKGVNALDLRAVMLEKGVDWYSYYYKTDHHWTSEAGLFAASSIAEKLNEFDKVDYDLSLYDKDNFNFTTYKNIMFGGQGRMVTRANADLEDYTCVLPKYDTNLTLEVDDKNEVYEGAFENSLYSLERLEEVKGYSGSDFLTLNDAYGTIRLNNSPLTRIINNDPVCNKDLKVLFIQDSFSWYSTAFLSLGLKETDIIYPIAFQGSIRTYVKETKPDIVVFSFCQKAIDPINYSCHETYFDLR